MEKSFRRPRGRTDLEDREAAGLWKAIALTKKIGEGDETITLALILRIHKTMLGSAFPEVAGRFRGAGEDIAKLKCVEPPPGRLVQEQMYAMWRELDARLSKLPRHRGKLSKSKRKRWYQDVIEMAAWVQHQIGAIHPFCEGNGRIARLLTNVILRRYGLRPSQVKYEGEDKPRYLEALCQIDHHGDYGPLKSLIIRGVLEVYRKEEVLRRKAA